MLIRIILSYHPFPLSWSFTWGLQRFLEDDVIYDCALIVVLEK